MPLRIHTILLLKLLSLCSPQSHGNIFEGLYPLGNRIRTFTAHPTNRFDQLHTNLDELHKQRMEKTHQKIVKPIKPVLRPFHPVTSMVDVNQPAYYGAVAPVGPYQYAEPMYHTRIHPLPSYSHLLPPVMTENRDYMI